MELLLNSRARHPPAAAVRILLATFACLLFPLPGRAAQRQVLHGHVPAVVSRLAPVGRLDATQRLNLAIALPLRNQQALTDLLRRLYDPASPSYRQFLTPAQFAAQFGPAEEDYETVAAFAKAHGLTVTHRYSNRLLLDVNGAVSDIENALHVTMRVYPHPTEARTFYAPDAEPSLDLAVPISHIGGLDNYAVPKPNFQPMPASRAAGAKPSSGSGPSGTYMGNDFRAAYAPGVSLTGSGQTIGLLEFDGYSASDISYYENLAGLPNVTLTNVLLDNSNGRGSGDGQVEVSLDIEVAISMAPGISQIIVYEAGSNGSFDDILNRMADDDLAKQLSCSWFESGQGDDPVADGIFQEMETQGQSFFCASGDSDAYTGLIPFPEDNVLVTEVGGTTLTDNGTGGSWSSETVWNWGYDSSAGGYVGSGGGISTQYSIPAWQQGISMTANLGSTTMRNIPDVALTADNVYVRVQRGNESVGGTSCAAPLWAGFIALVNQQAAANGKSTMGFINPAIYAIGKGSGYTSAFHDITTGNNTSSSSPTQFYAVAGYDLCTGWGTPNGAALINALAPTGARPVITSALTATATNGAAFSYLIAATNSPASYGASGLPAGLGVNTTSGLISGTTTATGTSSVVISATNASGTGSATLVLTVLPPHPVITSTLAATATNGAAFSYLIAATNSPSSYGASGLPAGLSVNTTSGLISGSTTATGTGDVIISATNAGGAGSAALLLTVLPPHPVITSTSSATTTEGQPFSYQITATNSPTSFGAPVLPAGLSVNTTTGLISGTATASGTGNFTISAANAGGTGSASLAILVQTPYAAWQSQVFSAAQLANPAISGATASPAGDSIPNLMKYALNLNPFTDGDSGLPVESIATTGSGNYLTLTYTQVLSATDITYTVQVSTDLQSWNSGPGYTSPPAPTNNPGGVPQSVTVQALAPVDGNTPTQFIRLQVTQP